VVLRDFFTTAVHEVGHVFGLSTRAETANQPFTNHDNDPIPWNIFCRDGSPVNRALIFAPEDPELDLASLPILPWSLVHDRKRLPTHHVVNGQLVPHKDKRRLTVALMAQSAERQNLAPQGSGARSLWMRGEDWVKMNNKALRLEIK
jgi:hypothetical protein